MGNGPTTAKEHDSSRFFTILHDSSRFFTMFHDSLRFFTTLHDSPCFFTILYDSSRFSSAVWGHGFFCLFFCLYRVHRVYVACFSFHVNSEPIPMFKTNLTQSAGGHVKISHNRNAVCIYTRAPLSIAVVCCALKTGPCVVFWCLYIYIYIYMCVSQRRVFVCVCEFCRKKKLNRNLAVQKQLGGGCAQAYRQIYQGCQVLVAEKCQTLFKKGNFFI